MSHKSNNAAKRTAARMSNNKSTGKTSAFSASGKGFFRNRRAEENMQAFRAGMKGQGI